MLYALDIGCSDEVITIVSLLQVISVFYRPIEKQTEADRTRCRFFHPDGDHLTLLNVYESWRDEGYSTSWCHVNFLMARALITLKKPVVNF